MLSSCLSSSFSFSSLSLSPILSLFLYHSILSSYLSFSFFSLKCILFLFLLPPPPFFFFFASFTRCAQFFSFSCLSFPDRLLYYSYFIFHLSTLSHLSSFIFLFLPLISISSTIPLSLSLSPSLFSLSLSYTPSLTHPLTLAKESKYNGGKSSMQVNISGWLHDVVSSPLRHRQLCIIFQIYAIYLIA